MRVLCAGQRNNAAFLGFERKRECCVSNANGGNRAKISEPGPGLTARTVAFTRGSYKKSYRHCSSAVVVLSIMPVSTIEANTSTKVAAGTIPHNDPCRCSHLFQHGIKQALRCSASAHFFFQIPISATRAASVFVCKCAARS